MAGRREEGARGCGGAHLPLHQHVLALAPRRRRELERRQPVGVARSDRVVPPLPRAADRQPALEGAAGGAAVARLGGVAPPPPAVRDAAGLPALRRLLGEALLLGEEGDAVEPPLEGTAHAPLQPPAHRELGGGDLLSRDLVGVLPPRAEGAGRHRVAPPPQHRAVRGEDVAAAQQRSDAPLAHRLWRSEGEGAVTRGRERRGRERRGTEAISRLQLFVLLRLAVLAQAAPAAEHAPLREADGRGLRRLVDRRAAVAERGAHRRLPPMHPEAERVCAVLVDDRGLGRRRRLRRRRCRAP